MQSIKDFIAGVQILFVAFGAMVLVPLLTGLNPSMALLGAGLGTLLFQIVTKRKVPIFLGSSFAFIAPIIFSLQTWGMGATMFGLFAAGFMYFVFALIIRWRGIGLVNTLIPPVVIGPVIMVIGLSVAVTATQMAMGISGGTPIMKDTLAIILSIATFTVTVLITIFGKGLFRLIPILGGIFAGYLITFVFDITGFSASLNDGQNILHLENLINARWFAVPQLHAPEVNWLAALFMLPVAIAPAIEHIGGIMAIGKVTGKDYTKDPGLDKTLAGDGLGVCVAGLIGGPPVTTYGEVTGAVMITKNDNPKIMTYAAIFAIAMAFMGKFNAFLNSIPLPVMGGIMILLFGTIASIGLKTLIDARVDIMVPRNLVIISATLITGVGGYTINIGSFPFAGVGLAAVLAIVLNLILPHPKESDAQD
ncbi:uracil-xanthine permease family protein [Wohlfahrtiimonas chitiniclastica]|uniref:uracil-xanthine permease family protein n=1 Tax=Wohlfahrtiimonas chitiniclastica TaxID=400946 RepID=UPI00037BF85B|nr:solute carrier family 23 protein [Wohlfahrtiimonas chitiniclastica]